MNTILQGIVVTVGNENVENSVYVDTSILEPFEDKYNPWKRELPFFTIKRHFSTAQAH